jgi:predicted RecA/RadA family phage recombinase
MKNFVQPGEIITFTAPTGGVTSGVPLLIGGVLVVPLVTAAQTVAFDGLVIGVCSYTKTASQAWSEGQAIFWNTSTSKFDSDGSTGPFVGYATVAVGSGAGETTGVVRLTAAPPSAGAVFHIRKRFSVAQVNAGATLLAAVAGVKYRMIDCATIAIGGAASQPFNVLGTSTTERKLVANAAAQSTQSTLLRAGATGSTLLADGASHTANDANTAITVKKDSADVATATSIDVLFTYAMDPA